MSAAECNHGHRSCAVLGLCQAKPGCEQRQAGHDAHQPPDDHAVDGGVRKTSAAAPMTAAVRAAVDYILRQACPVDWIEIIDIFVADEDWRRETRSMREGLRQAERLGLLVSDGRGIDRVWARPGHVFADPATAHRPARAPAWCGPTSRGLKSGVRPLAQRAVSVEKGWG